MKEDKDIIEEAWAKEPCHNPLEPARWTWNIKFIREVKTRILTCVNSLWWNHHK